VKSLTLSVPSAGRYWVDVTNDVYSGILETDEGLPFFDVTDEWQPPFASNARFAFLRSSTPSEAFAASDAFTPRSFSDVRVRPSLMVSTAGFVRVLSTRPRY
jgi:hypothetical protein